MSDPYELSWGEADRYEFSWGSAENVTETRGKKAWEGRGPVKERSDGPPALPGLFAAGSCVAYLYSGSFWPELNLFVGFYLFVCLL